MTIMAGFFSLSPQFPIKDSLCDAIENGLSRKQAGKINTYRNDRAYLASLDLNAFRQPAFHVKDRHSVTVLAGEPLIDHGVKGFCTRLDDLQQMQDELDTGQWQILQKANGIFCAAHYNMKSETLFLISDKLALRPVYYCHTKHYILFTSALRILESLDGIPRHLDLRGVTEISAFGFPLANRSPYSEIKMLRPGEILSVSNRDARIIRYWRWDKTSRWKGSEEELGREAHARFVAAVKRRLRDDRAVLSFLSGGLDSRLIVGLLRHMGVAVHTFTFGVAGTQDLYFASRFADAAGTIHEQIEPKFGPDNPWAKMLADAWEFSNRRTEKPPERPGTGWSGDGGSVIVGRVYLLRTMVELLKAGQREEAINIYLQNYGSTVLKRLIRQKAYNEIAGLPVRGIEEELDTIQCDDPLRQFYLFLVLNDQRHHLMDHYENIDLHGLELHQPFFDSHFMEAIISGPIEGGLYHRFYAKWLKYFPPIVTSVPWQAYPGHQPSPLPLPDNLGYQWGQKAARRNERRYKQYYVREAQKMLSSPDFPHDILELKHLRVATFMHRLGLKDYGYVIKTASVYHRYWKCQKEG